MDTNDIKDKAQNWQETAEDLQEQARDWKKAATETARNTSKAVDEYVHENTWMSIAVIAIASCTLGFLLGRSRD
jgi:ElaB/YqjD/DUF883 family membrane-anchored ribosome-binding protein